MGAHGLRGEVRVHFFGNGPENLLQVPSVEVAQSSDDPTARPHEVVGARPGRGGEVRLALSGIEDRDAAESLRGCWILADTGHLAPLPPDEHYWHELVGCRVFSSEGRLLGTIRELWDTGAHDVMVVDAEDGSTQLLPAAEDLLVRIDPEKREVWMELLPGMLLEE